jgi:hypothetical protein
MGGESETFQSKKATCVIKAEENKATVSIRSPGLILENPNPSLPDTLSAPDNIISHKPTKKYDSLLDTYRSRKDRRELSKSKHITIVMDCPPSEKMTPAELPDLNLRSKSATANKKNIFDDSCGLKQKDEGETDLELISNINQKAKFTIKKSKSFAFIESQRSYSFERKFRENYTSEHFSNFKFNEKTQKTVDSQSPTDMSHLDDLKHQSSIIKSEIRNSGIKVIKTFKSAKIFSDRRICNNSLRTLTTSTASDTKNTAIKANNAQGCLLREKNELKACNIENVSDPKTNNNKDSKGSNQQASTSSRIIIKDFRRNFFDCGESVHSYSEKSMTNDQRDGMLKRVLGVVGLILVIIFVVSMVKAFVITRHTSLENSVGSTNKSMQGLGIRKDLQVNILGELSKSFNTPNKTSEHVSNFLISDDSEQLDTKITKNREETKFPKSSIFRSDPKSEDFKIRQNLISEISFDGPSEQATEPNRIYGRGDRSYRFIIQDGDSNSNSVANKKSSIFIDDGKRQEKLTHEKYSNIIHI